MTIVYKRGDLVVRFDDGQALEGPPSEALLLVAALAEVGQVWAERRDDGCETRLTIA